MAEAKKFSGDGSGGAGDDTSPPDQAPSAAFGGPDPVSAEPKAYPDVVERDSVARPDESISGEEEDFLSE